MTRVSADQMREQFEAWWWKRHPDYTSELLKRTSKSGAYDSDWVNGMWLAWKAALATAPPEQAAPVGYPRPCGLCPGQIESEADLDWHGIGNCVPICDHCGGSGKEPTRFIIRDEESVELSKLEAKGTKWKQSAMPQPASDGVLDAEIVNPYPIRCFNCATDKPGNGHTVPLCGDCYEKLRLALRLASHDQKVREPLATWMIANSFATGHGDTVEDLLGELKWQIKERAQKVRREVLEQAALLVEKAFEQSWVVQDTLDAIRSLVAPAASKPEAAAKKES